MFPINDENPQLRTPLVTYTLIGLNLLSWFILQGSGTEPAIVQSVCRFGLIPGELLNAYSYVPGSPANPCPVTGGASWLTMLTSMFMHGGWMHILGNLWFLWVFGDNVEDAMGSLRFLAFYLLCGLAAAAAQIASDSSSPIPMVGASGAIGGVMGAYIMLYPRVHVHMLVFLGFFVTVLAVPAVMMLGYWILLQFLGVLRGGGGGVAFWAHIGGFAAGAALVWPFRDRALLNAHPYHGWKQRQHATGLWKKPGRR